MPLPIEDLTPRQIVAELDKYIVGQAAAKRAVAVALRNRFRRQQMPEAERQDVTPKNILMIGPTGVGKTEIARRLAQIARAPFIKVEATKFTEVGYVGRDVESMVRELVATAVRLVETERFTEIKEEAERRAFDRLLDLLEDDDARHVAWMNLPEDPEEHAAYLEKQEVENAARRESLKDAVLAGEKEDELVEIDSEESASPFVQVFSNQGIEEMGLDGGGMGGPFGTRRITRRVTVSEARGLLVEEESKKMVDRTTIQREAIYRAEQTGIIFLDEIDKVAGKNGGSGPDVSREGVQRDLLPIIEGSTVQTKFGPVRTDHVLFIAAGAFHMSKPSDLIPELQGRLPIRVQLQALTESDFRRILLEPKNALTKQYVGLLATEGVQVEFTADALEEIARLAAYVNAQTENIGARRLSTMMERLLEDVLFDAPDVAERHLVFDGAKVREELGDIAEDTEASRQVL
jgi:ATP-dependent HslUV protease ATP-binding subunit HslU